MPNGDAQNDGGALWYGIMLDDEFDSVSPDYYPVRYASLSRESIEREMWIVGNADFWIADEWSAELIKSKSLLDQNSRVPFGGAIYRFRNAAQGAA